MQAPATTVAYDVSSAAATFNANNGALATGIDGHGVGPSTVTITTDASGNLSQVTFAVSTGGTTFNQTYSAAELFASPGNLTLGDLTTGIQEIALAGAGSHGFLMNGDLSYATYGAWMQNDGGGIFRIGALAGGAETPPASMPAAGSATYNGETVGVAAATDGSSYAFIGDSQVQADFGASTVTTTFSNINTRNLDTNANGTLPTISGAGAIAGNTYSSNLNANGYAGTAEGAFFGPNAEETAGAWRASNGTVTVIGTYGGEQ